MDQWIARRALRYAVHNHDITVYWFFFVHSFPLFQSPKDIRIMVFSFFVRKTFKFGFWNRWEFVLMYLNRIQWTDWAHSYYIHNTYRIFIYLQRSETDKRLIAVWYRLISAFVVVDFERVVVACVAMQRENMREPERLVNWRIWNVMEWLPRYTFIINIYIRCSFSLSQPQKHGTQTHGHMYTFNNVWPIIYWQIRIEWIDAKNMRHFLIRIMQMSKYGLYLYRSIEEINFWIIWKCMCFSWLSTRFESDGILRAEWLKLNVRQDWIGRITANVWQDITQLVEWIIPQRAKRMEYHSNEQWKTCMKYGWNLNIFA